MQDSLRSNPDVVSRLASNLHSEVKLIPVGVNPDPLASRNLQLDAPSLIVVVVAVHGQEIGISRFKDEFHDVLVLKENLVMVIVLHTFEVLAVDVAHLVDGCLSFREAKRLTIDPHLKTGLKVRRHISVVPVEWIWHLDRGKTRVSLALHAIVALHVTLVELEAVPIWCLID